jgi:hypothetical protein
VMSDLSFVDMFAPFGPELDDPLCLGIGSTGFEQPYSLVSDKRFRAATRGE